MKIKRLFYNILSLANKKNITSLLVLLLALSFYTLAETSNNIKYDFYTSLSFKFNDSTCIFMLTLLFFVASNMFLKKLKNRVEITTRFKGKKEYYKYILINIFTLITIIYIIVVILLFIFRFFKEYFVISSDIYFLYDISSTHYFIWSVIKLYLYLLFIVYVNVLITFNIDDDKINLLWIILCIIQQQTSVLNIFNNKYISLISYFSYTNYGSFLNEILCFISSLIINYYIIKFIIIVLPNINPFTIKSFIYKIWNKLKKVYYLLILYIIINIINITVFQEYDYIELLIVENLKNMSNIGIITNGASLFILLIIKVIINEINNNSFIFLTRISKKKLYINKLKTSIIILLLYRIIIYYLLGFNSYCIIDFISYLIILIYLFNYYYKDKQLYFILFLAVLFTSLVIKINYNILIIYIGLLITANLIEHKD